MLINQWPGGFRVSGCYNEQIFWKIFSIRALHEAVSSKKNKISLSITVYVYYLKTRMKSQFLLISAVLLTWQIFNCMVKKLHNFVHGSEQVCSDKIMLNAHFKMLLNIVVRDGKINLLLKGNVFSCIQVNSTLLCKTICFLVIWLMQHLAHELVFGCSSIKQVMWSQNVSSH